MPLNPSAFSMLDTQAPERLADLFNPIRRDEQRNSLADLANQREMRKIQLTDAQQAQRDNAELKMALEHSGGDYEKMYQFAVQANTPESMAFANKIRPELERMRGGSIADKLAREKFDYEKANPSVANPKIPMAPVAYVNEKGETVWGTITEAKGRPAANYSPTIQGQVAGAKASGSETGKSTGESEAKLADMESMMPRLEVVTKELSDLGKKATYTMVGQGANFARRQLGMNVGEGAVARKEYISKVDNEILPLLRQTFGAQFTQKEGESLKATLGDTNASPEEKDAVLKSFIQTKYGQIAALQRRTGAQQSGAYDADKEARYQAWKAQQGR